MLRVVLVFLIIVFFSFSINSSLGFFGGDLVYNNQFSGNSVNFEQTSGIIQISTLQDQLKPLKRYIIFGSDSIDDAKTISPNLLYSIGTKEGFFSVGVLSENEVSKLRTKGYYVLEDFPVDFHTTKSNITSVDISRIDEITGAKRAHDKYGYSGKGIKIGIVDTGVDFSNPDIKNSLARDEKNHPIMLDADGQGIILTNATFIANIDETGILRNYTGSIPENVTSKVYRTKQGVFLDVHQNGNGTTLLVYNSFFPQGGFGPIFNGTISDDMKIGKDGRDYIISRSGIYHLGIIYQGALQGPLTRIQAVPVLVVDSKVAGLYDTIIPDMSTSWKDFTRHDLKIGEKPGYDFDFTDENPITLGSGEEFLTYDFDEDGKLDYSAGTVGARVLDIYGVVNNKKSNILDKTIKAVNGTLLPALDPKGSFFGVMTDFFGHGTSSAASITSEGKEEYDIYNNTKKYSIKGVAPGAKIVPIKALWFGDTVYASLWAAGFNNFEDYWTFDGKPRVDILSNSWGISNFPSLKYAPGLDVISLIHSILAVPGTIDDEYPGITIVTSAGNSGHGYGTIGTPNASPYGITVGATTNNVFVGFGGYKDQPRFGNTTDHYNHVVDFSSRGPGIIGDPKPDLMSIGAYSFTPTIVTKMNKDSKQEPFALFGGTSMAAPIVSGSAAILMESLNEKFEEYDPFRIKNILMSTAVDLKNDPFTQGTGLVNVYDAVNFVNGKEEIFIVHNDGSYSKIKDILDVPLLKLNSSAFGIEKLELPKKSFPQANWYGGQMLPGDRSTTTFTVENPSDVPINIYVKPTSMKLIKKTQFTGDTEARLQDPMLNKSDAFAPNYIRLSDVIEHKDLPSFYDDSNPIPSDASLMILNVNFDFGDFMNKTTDIYADDLKISSLYLYDWADKNDDKKIASDELSMVQRGGSWGTVQEIRVSDPTNKFDNVPVVGVYPVPTRYSYWLGDTRLNSTSMNYTLSSSYFDKERWELIWVDKSQLTVPAKSSRDITATITIPSYYKPGVYQGFLSFVGDKHTANVPVSFVVKKMIDKKDSLVVLSGSKSDNTIYGNGFVKGAFDMVNRYMAGDWRQIYFDIEDKTINTAAIDISWENEDSNLSVFMIDPTGKIIQTNVPSGVFGHFMDWPSVDWLGPSPFSQGGGFFPVKNKDKTSTVLYAPINQTGTYSVLVHSTLFGGKEITEPFTVTAKFTTILPDDEAPTIYLEIPEFINSSFSILPKIEDDNLDFVKYYIDEIETNFTSIGVDSGLLREGQHELKIFASDIVGQSVTEKFTFNVDDTPPIISIDSPKNDTSTSGILLIDFKVTEDNLLENGGITIALPDGKLVSDKTSFQYDTNDLADGNYDLKLEVIDKAGNSASRIITFNVDKSIPQTASFFGDDSTKINLAIIVMIVGVIIGVLSTLVVIKKLKITQNK